MIYHSNYMKQRHPTDPALDVFHTAIHHTENSLEGFFLNLLVQKLLKKYHIVPPFKSKPHYNDPPHAE